MATDCGAPVWAAGFEDQIGDLLKVEDSISEQVAQALIPQMTGEERKQLARTGTASPKAHEAHLRGRWYWSRHTEDALPQALVLFSAAIAEDPDYGRAHAGIADYHLALGIRGLLPPAEAFGAAIDCARRALRLDPKLAEAHASLGLATWLHDGDFETAAHEFQHAIALNPDYSAAHDWFGLMNAARAQAEMAVASIERAIRIDSGNPIYVADLALCHYISGRWREACGLFSSEPSPIVNSAVWPLSLLASGEPRAALRAARSCVEASERSSLMLAVLALAESAAGTGSRAETLLAELETRARNYYVPGTVLALANLACGRRNEALRQLQRARRERDWWSAYAAIMPVWNELRDDPRFKRLTRDARGFETAASPRRGPPYSRRWWLTAAAVCSAALAAWFLRPMRVAVPFQTARISRLTTSGNAERAAISPDGRAAAYVLRQEGSATVWVRKIDDGTAARVAGPLDALVPWLHFTSDGGGVAFYAMTFNGHSGNLYVVPAAGGEARALRSGTAVPTAISADESRFAYTRTASDGNADELVLVEGGKERVLRRRPRPEVYTDFPAPVFSPDGRRIVCAVQGPGKDGFGIRLEIVGLDGASRLLGGVVWQSIHEVAWSKKPESLLVAGQDVDSPFPQIWRLTLDGSSLARVTNDLHSYSGVSVDAAGQGLVAVQAQSTSNLYRSPAGDTANPVQISTGSGRYFDVTWTPGGNIVYASDATGSAEIWSIDSSGNNQRQLTHGLGRTHGPVMSPDGRTIAFHSNRGGVWNVWKMDPDGRNAIQVTHDSSDSHYPRFTPDGRSVVYQHIGSDALSAIWRIGLDGGTPVRLTTMHSTYAAVAPDGRMAVWVCQDVANPKWEIAIYEPGAAQPSRRFSFPSNRMPEAQLHWMPKENAISYSENRDVASNIWAQPADGGPPRQITHFTSGHIYSFDWSPDGQLLYSRGVTTTDVVPMRDSSVREPR